MTKEISNDFKWLAERDKTFKDDVRKQRISRAKGRDLVRALKKNSREHFSK